MHCTQILAVAALLATTSYSSPVQEVNARNLTPSQCSKVQSVVDVLKLYTATPFCSSFLSIKTATSTSTIKVTSTATTTKTSTITTGTTSTSIVFKPGNPPAKIRREAESDVEQRDATLAAVQRRESSPTIPAYVSAYATTAISSACSCLNIPTPTTTVTTTKTATTTKTVSTSKTVQPPVVTSTKYPCATPIPTKVPTIPYGKSDGTGVGETSNSRYYLDTPEGETLEGCCNVCYFGIPNCIQAFWYSYQGCVVQQAVAPSGSGVGVSSVCPNGKISGLTYNRDTGADFRSTGDIAGPCGQVYNNF
ncbi:hypothetical protein G7Y79_00004g012360 [Physcia stellaris]|nr:hypothetical protein G7Y79_00004g012360 [Physcia stellaris]